MTKHTIKPTYPLFVVSFFAADVQAGVGPFLGIYLQAHGWTPDRIGTVLTIGGIIGMLVTTPAGALVDATSRRRAVVAVASALSIVAAIIIWTWQGFWPVTLSQIATAVAGATMGPALAGLTLGIVGRENFDRQFGRNQVANHAGNIAAAMLSGWLGAWLGMPYIFALSAAFGAGCILAALWIPPRSVHRHFARGIAKEDSDDTDDSNDVRADAMRVLLRNHSLLVLAAALAAFNLGNSAMLPLYSLAVASTHTADPSHVTAANIVISQIVMLIAAACASRAIRRWGFWRIILVTLATLPLRAMTAAWIAPSWGIVPVQMLDGVGAGLQSVAVPALVVHLLHGSGRVNLGQGAVQGVEAAGACMSPILGGWIAHHYGYPAAFLALGSLSVVSLAIWIGYGQRVRGSFDTRRDELGKLADVDSSTLFR
ncbi:major facilitator transporter [Caballeronia fortuita]|uniref:Major facilitator transporter n=1 Tax=Caballeronia fortuita TaxID=1777138 RepID=A0A158AKZ0_9BURK|nr:MFS transporter [Caballeronia fortuita]SAK58236.1 major facilitator transporter [Caballeronia fortuita]